VETFPDGNFFFKHAIDRTVAFFCYYFWSLTNEIQKKFFFKDGTQPPSHFLQLHNTFLAAYMI